MIIGIEASNIRTGGGKKHLKNFVLNSLKYFDEVNFVIVSNKNVNGLFQKNNRIHCVSNSLLNSNSFLSFISQLFFTLISSTYVKNNFFIFKKLLICIFSNEQPFLK